MSEKVYNKLVRDKIPAIIEGNGETAVTRVLSDEEYKAELITKLQEEVKEFLESEETEELADIVEVIYGLLNYKGMSIDEFEKIRIAKAQKRGGFLDKIFLEKTIKQD